MDTIFQALFSWQFLLFCLAIAAVLFIIRRVFEYVMETRHVGASESKLWKELILPILPVVLGPTAAYFAQQYPYPAGLNSGSARVAFGLVAGLLSGLVYRVLKSALGYKIKNPGGPDYSNYYNQYPNSAIGTPDAPLGELEQKVRESINKDQ